MTILHVTDFHFHPRWFEWLVEGAPPHDLLCISGDILSADSPAAHGRQADQVVSWLRRVEVPMVVCSGNHDLEHDDRHERWLPARWLLDLAGPRVAVDGGTLVWRGVRIHAVGCVAYPKGTSADVWVAHAPPTGLAVGRRAFGFDDGDPDLDVAAARHRPAVILSGHIHDPATWFERRDGIVHINPGSAEHGRFPNHVIVDWDRRTAHRVCDSMPGAHCEVATWPAPHEQSANTLLEV